MLDINYNHAMLKGHKEDKIMDRIWHGVIIEPDGKGRRGGQLGFGEPALSRELSEEIEDWIIEHVENGGHGIWKNTTFLVYHFTSEEIAMAFKLRWA